MHLRGLDLNLLIALDVLLVECNVTRAAEKMNISQPGMSGALRKLREHFDDPLLESVGRQMELTPRARELQDAVHDVVQRARRLVEMAPAFDPASSDRMFTIAGSSLCSELLAMPLTRRLLAEAPGIRLRFEDLSDISIMNLHRGSIDAVITIPQAIRLNDREIAREFGEQLLFTDRMVLAMAAGNPLIGDTLTYEQLCRLQFVETRFSGLMPTIPEQILRRQIKQPLIHFWLPNFQQSLVVAANTDMVTILPSLIVARHRKDLDVRAMEVPFDLPLLSERLYWHPRHDDDLGHVWLREVLAEVAAEATAVPGETVLAAAR